MSEPKMYKSNAAPPATLANRVGKKVKPYVIGPSNQLLLKQFVHPSTPSSRKVDGREKIKEK